MAPMEIYIISASTGANYRSFFMKQPQRDPQFKLRLSPERLEWVKKRAEANNRTTTAEINFILGYFKFLEEQGNVPRIA